MDKFCSTNWSIIFTSDFTHSEPGSKSTGVIAANAEIDNVRENKFRNREVLARSRATGRNSVQRSFRHVVSLAQSSLESDTDHLSQAEDGEQPLLAENKVWKTQSCIQRSSQ